MKNKNTLLGLVGFSCIILMLHGFTNQTDEFNNVGDVKISILPPDIFSQTQKGTWVVLNGSNLSEDSGLYQLLADKAVIDGFPKREGKAIVPDLRGKFIRSMNINGEGNDPVKNRKIGSYQADKIINHNHSGYFAQNKGWSFEHHKDYGGNRMRLQYTTPKTGGVTGSKSTSETRPKNIAFYHYMKISN